jgi:hypothetical protein
VARALAERGADADSRCMRWSRHRLAIALAAAVALGAASPAAASETVYVASGVMTYASAPGQTDAIVVSDGGTAWVVRDDVSPSGQVGSGCSVSGMTATCPKAWVTSASLATLDGNDSVTLAGAPPSVVHGGDGDDAIVGGPAADRLHGDAGNDRIDARDGHADVVDCGAGDDRAQLDAIDTAVDCEFDPLDAPAAGIATPADGDTTTDGAADPSEPATTLPRETGPPTTGLPTALPPVGPATILAGPPVRVSRAGVAPLELACGIDQKDGCRGVVYLDPAPRRKARGAAVVAFAARRGRFGSAAFRAAPGERAKVDVRLTAAARRALGLRRAKSKRRKARAARRGRRVKAVVTVKSKKGGRRRAMVVLRG